MGCCLLVSMVLATSAIAYYDHNRLRPSVHLGNIALGGLTKIQASQRLAERLSNYKVKLTVADKSVSLKPADLGVDYNLNATVAAAYQAGRDGRQRSDRGVAFVFRIDSIKADKALATLVSDVGIAPVNAIITVTNGTPTIVPEQAGRGITSAILRKIIAPDLATATSPDAAIAAQVVAPTLTAVSAAPALTEAQQLMTIPISLTIDTRSFSPRPADIAGWLDFVPSASNPSQLDVVPNDTKIAVYAKSVATQVDIPQVSQLVTNENGVSTITSAGVDGSGIDQPLITAAIKAALVAKQPLAYALAMKPVAFKTVTKMVITLALGRYVEVNTTTQHLTVWQDHQIIYESGAITGAAQYGLGTDPGLFAIYEKQTNRYLDGCWRGRCYHLHVNYWMPFNQGDGLHDAYWRNGVFGTQDYYYNGSHGCVNLPDATAEFLWNWSTVGTPVWVHA